MSNTTATQTVLGPNSVLRGELAMQGNVTIMGRVDGDIRVAGTLELTETAEVTGTIIVGALRLAGRADADVIAEQSIELLPGSKLSGRLFSTRITVSEGGEYEGEINVGPQALKAAVEWIEQIKREQDGQHQPRPASVDTAAPADSAPEPEQDQADDAADSTERDQEPVALQPQIDPSVIGSILSQRRAKVMAAVNAPTGGAEATRVAG